MSTVVVKLSAAQMQQAKAFYQNVLTNKSIPYTSFTALKSGVSITGYSSGKLMFQGTAADKEAQQWQASSGTVTPKKAGKKTTKSASLPAGFSNWSVIGSDEVGNGSYFGPVTVCAAYAEKEHHEALKKMGVRDSKELTDTQIRSIAAKVKELIPFQLLVLSPKKYNEIQPTYNAVRMKVALHNQAILLLLKKIAPKKPEAILIDQFTPEGNYRKYVQQEKQQVQETIYFETKGEQHHLAVAAASIISRASFLDELELASAEAGLTLPSGAGSKSDQIAAKLLQKGGIPLLEKYAKLHFANTQKAQKLLQK